ncbi:phospholipase D-like domain-containing protein [soil metagenome]
MAGMVGRNVDKGTWFDRVDDRVGDGLEWLMRRHHARRLRRLGWDDVLGETGDAEDGTGPDSDTWWSVHAEVRTGNRLEVLVDGSCALPAMAAAIRGAREFVHVAGWHASPDFIMHRDEGQDGGEVVLRDLLAEVAERVPVRLLLWAEPPLPVFQPTRSQVTAVRDEFMRDSQVQCFLDGRGRTMHCHHEKLVIVDGTVAFVGGIDLTALQGDRYDAPDHPPTEPLGWHDAAVRLSGPAVADVARHFNQRWSEVAGERLAPPVVPAAAGDTQVQVVRTVPERTYGFSSRGDFSILDAYLRSVRGAQRFIYLENQFLWSPEVVDILADKLENPPCEDFRILLLLPSRPNDGKETTRGQLGRLVEADAGGQRLLATTLTAHDGVRDAQVYVHAKVGIVDDRWLTIGSANLNEHSLCNDTEMNVLTCDAELARTTRLQLWSEHIQRPVEELDKDPCAVIDEVWRSTAGEQDRRVREGLPRTHRLSTLSHMSRRTDRLEGPLRGLLVDG